MVPLLIFERVVLAYFAAILVLAMLMRERGRRRLRAAAAAAVVLMALAGAALFTSVDVRVWLGHLYLLTGYWIPALLVGPTPREPAISPTAFDAWLVECDRRWCPVSIRWPDWAIPLLELAYLLCLPLVPAAFASVWLTGRIADVDRFWTAVLAAGFLCYGTLPWLVSRPPRTVESVRRRSIGRLNEYVVARTTHGFNTFPSGHVAVAFVAALETLPTAPLAGVVFLVVAAAIAAGAVAGRYHYALDVFVGCAMAVAIAAAI